MIRRFTWTLIRVEAEHVTNVGKQRAFAEVPLPSLERARLAAAQNWETMGQMGVVGGGGAGARGGALRSVLGGARRRKNQEFRATLMAETTVVS